MKSRLLITAALMALAASSAEAQRLSMTTAKIDVGRTGYEIPVTATFELRNRGFRRLIIEDVKPDCYCTTVEYPKDEIGVGEKFTIRVTYDARQLGHFNKQVAVVSNGSKKPVYLTMTGVVLAELHDYSGAYPYDFNNLLSDANNLEFDNVQKGEERTFDMRIMNNGDKPMQPNVLHLPAYLSAKAYPEHLQPGHSGKLLFTLHSEKIRDYGLTQTSVYLAQQLGEKVNSETEISMSAVLLPPITQTDNAPHLALSDSVLNIDFAGKEKKTGDIVLTNKGQAPLDISSLQMFTGGLKVTLGKSHLNPGEQTKLKITAVAEELKTVRTVPRVLMITNDPDYQKVVITINTH